MLLHRRNHEFVAREERGVAQRQVMWAPWSPAQIVALAFGIFLLVLGAATLSNTGLSGNAITATKVTTWGFGGTAVMGLIEVAAGLLLILAGAIPGAGRGTMAFLGVLALGFGILILAAQPSLYDGLGVNHAAGWLFLITGIVNLLAAMLAPVFIDSHSSATAYDDEVVHHDRV